MESPVEVLVTLGNPALPAGQEPEEPAYARVRVRRREGEAAVRPRLDLCFILDASASMHRFVLTPEQRTQWQQRAEQRGEVSRQQVDGRTGLVWGGQTLREMQQQISTPMLSTLRGVWRVLEALDAGDSVSVLAFADRDALIYQDRGADGPSRLAAAKAALGRLGSGVDESGLGRGTRLEGALRRALDLITVDGGAGEMRRIVLVSDGIVQDFEICRSLLDTAVDRGVVISVIGVGDEFDEEFLMLCADLTRGNYYYAASAPEVEQAVRQEMEIITQVLGQHALLRIHPENGTIIQDVYPIAPALSEFHTLWVEEGGWRLRIGDLSAAQDMEFLLQLAPGAHGAGEVRLGRARVEAHVVGSPHTFAVEVPVSLYFADDPVLLQARDDEVLDSVRRLEVYRLERRAAEAAASGDADGSTRALRAATKMLRTMGKDGLADEMDAAAEAAETGTRNLALTKRVKSGTRRLR